MLRGVKRRRAGAGKPSKKQSYETLVIKFKQELVEQESLKQILEGKLIAVDNFQGLVSAVEHGNIQTFMESLRVTQEQAVQIINMKIADFLPGNKDQLKHELEEVQKEVNRLQRLSEDYQACLRVMQYEELEISDAELAEQESKELYNLEDQIDGKTLRKSKSPKKLEEERCKFTKVDENIESHLSTQSIQQADTEEQQPSSGPSTPSTHAQNDDADCLVIGYIEGKVQKLEFVLFLQCIDKHSGRMGRLDQYAVARRDQQVLLFTTSGHAYSVLPDNIPNGTAVSPKQLLGTCTTMQIAEMIPSNNISDGQKLILLTKFGQLKCSQLNLFSKSKQGGQVVIGLHPEDELMCVVGCHPCGAVLIGTASGRVVCVRSQDIPEGGKVSKGIRAAKLRGVDHVVSIVGVDAQVSNLIPGYAKSCSAAEPDDDVEIVGPNNAGPWLLIFTSRGLCKRVPINRFRIYSSTAYGITSTPLRNHDELHSIMFVPSNCIGMQVLICTQHTYSQVLRVCEVPIKSRQTVGQKLIELDPDDFVREVLLLPKAIKKEGEEEST